MPENDLRAQNLKFCARVFKLLADQIGGYRRSLDISREDIKYLQNASKVIDLLIGLYKDEKKRIIFKNNSLYCGDKPLLNVKYTRS